MPPAKKLTVTYETNSTAVTKAHHDMATSADSLGSKFSTVGQGMVSQFEKLGNSFGLNVGGMKATANQAESAIGGLGQGVGGLATGLGLGIGVAVGLGAALKGMADTSANLAGEIRKLQAITGASAEDASRLRHEFVHFGVDADAGGTALVKFSKNLEEGTGKFKGWFTEADLARMKGQDLTKDLPLLAEKYQSLGTAVEKNTFLLDVFGKGGTALRPILAANAADIARVGREADKLGLTFSQKGLADAKAYTIAQRDLGEAMKGLEVQIGRGVTPALTGFTASLTKAIAGVTSLNDKMKNATGGAFGLGNAFQALMGTPYSAKAVENAAATDKERLALEAENVSLQQNAKDAEAATKAQEALSDKVVKSFSPLSNAISGIASLDKSTASAAKTDDQYAYDLQKLNELRKDGVINTKALDAAMKGIESTSRATETAQVALVKAGDTVTTALKKEADAARALQTLLGGPAPADQAKAEEDIGKAKVANTEASLGLQDAIDAENVLKASGTATDRQLLDASLAVQKARFAATDAVTAQAAAEKGLYDLQHAADVGSIQRVTLEDNLATAHDAVTDSLRAQADATRAVTDARLAEADAAKALQVAQAPDEAMVKAISDAERTLAKDTQSAGGALSGLASTTAISFSEIKAQLTQQIADMTNWAANLKFLVEHGVTDSVLGPLAEMGPKAGPALQALRDEVVAHGAGAINDLGAGIAAAEQKVNDALATEHAGIQAFYTQNPIVVAADLRFSKEQIAAMQAFAGQSVQRAGGAQTFQEGGFVRGPYGSPQLIVAHAGEEVIPIGGRTGNSGGNTYIVNVNVAGNAIHENNLTSVIYEQLLELQRRQGSLGFL